MLELKLELLDEDDEDDGADEDDEDDDGAVLAITWAGHLPAAISIAFACGLVMYGMAAVFKFWARSAVVGSCSLVTDHAAASSGQI